VYHVLTDVEIVERKEQYRAELINDFKLHAFRIGDFTLASGEKSKFYFNVKNAYTFPNIMQKISSLLMFELNNVEYDVIGGVELGAIPLITATSMKTHKPFIMLRKFKKDYGAKQLIEGKYAQGSKVVMIEDVTTTGGSVIKAIDLLRNNHAVVDTVVTVVDRANGAKEALGSMGIRLIPLFTLADFTEGDQVA